MDDYKFQHELNPELRGQASLDNQRSEFIAEFQYAKSRLVVQSRRWLFCFGLLVLSTILGLWLPPTMAFVLLLVCVVGILYLMRGNNVVRLSSTLREMVMAKKRLRDWEAIVKDAERTKDQKSSAKYNTY
jgi:Flp pilus assembly protein TadB